MTRIIAGFLLAALFVALLAWFLNGIGGAGFWYNVGQVLLAVPFMLLRFFWWTPLAYLGIVIWTGSWTFFT